MDGVSNRDNHCVPAAQQLISSSDNNIEVYTGDLPETSATRYVYADDVALTISASIFREAELALLHDISVVNTYMIKRKLRLSVEKTVCSVFHLKNCSTNYQLNVKRKPNVTVKFDSHPSYLGICMDRSLSFRTHLHTLKKKVSSRVALIKRLAGVGWCGGQKMAPHVNKWSPLDGAHE